MATDRSGILSNSMAVILPQSDFRAIQSFALAPPPVSGRVARREVGEMIFVQHGAEVARRFFGKRILFEQREHLRGALGQANQEVHKPRIAAIITEGSEPHLPVESRLLRRDEGEPARWGPRLPVAMVEQAGDGAVARC